MAADGSGHVRDAPRLRNLGARADLHAQHQQQRRQQQQQQQRRRQQREQPTAAAQGPCCGCPQPLRFVSSVACILEPEAMCFVHCCKCPLACHVMEAAEATAAGAVHNGCPRHTLRAPTATPHCVLNSFSSVHSHCMPAAWALSTCMHLHGGLDLQPTRMSCWQMRVQSHATTWPTCALL